MSSKAVHAGGLTMIVMVTLWTSAAGTAADDAGKRLYEGTCSRCHGAEGQGRGNVAPPLVPFDWSYEEALHLIRQPVCDMPPIPESELSNSQIAQIVAYLKSLK
jgi:mono/diheme cytochrome c family protein